MQRNEYRVTKENYKDLLYEKQLLLENFDFNSLNNQVDYENDYYIAAQMNEMIWNVSPMYIYSQSIELCNAEVVTELYDGLDGIICYEDVDDSAEFCGSAVVSIDDIGHHNYLVLYGKSEYKDIHPYIIVTNSEGDIIEKIIDDYTENDWKQYVVDLSNYDGDVTIYFGVKSCKDIDASFIFSNITLY